MQTRLDKYIKANKLIHCNQLAYQNNTSIHDALLLKTSFIYKAFNNKK
jgi:hypothetical protein